MDWLQTLLTPAVLLAVAAFAWRVQRASRTDDQQTVARAVEGLRGDVRDLRGDVRDLSREVANIDKRLVAVATLLHERTGRLIPTPEPATAE